MVDDVPAYKEELGVEEFVLDEVAEGVLGDVYYVVVCNTYQCPNLAARRKAVTGLLPILMYNVSGSMSWSQRPV